MVTKKTEPTDDANKTKRPCDSDTWRNRRRMAYFSLFSIVIITYWAMFLIPETRLKILGEVITWFYFVMGSVVGAYMGFSAFENKWNNKGDK